MDNPVIVPRNLKILAVCVPIAALVGYLLADPLQPTSLAVFILIFSVLSVPLMMKWHHPLLVLSWNAAVAPAFLPGRPRLWACVALGSIFFALLSRSVDTGRKFLSPPSIHRPLLFLCAVVVATAFLTGGVGVRSLGSEKFGGRSYFYILTAVAGYFALTSHSIPQKRAGIYVGMFFLSGLTWIVADLIYLAGPPFYFLYDYFAADMVWDLVMANESMSLDRIRVGGFYWASIALSCFLLARYGIRGMADWTRPWRIVLFLAAFIASLAGGYRSALILILLTFSCMFYFEGLHRTKYLTGLILSVILGGALLIPHVTKLPYAMQRALSFLPINVDPMVKYDAVGSTEWRLEMWRKVLPDVPKYLLVGKGYALDPGELFLTHDGAFRGRLNSQDVATLAGDYHNGPLSLIIPLGIFGMIGFLWYLGAGLKLLCQYWRDGDPSLRTFNTFLLAYFVARIIFFFAVFGGFSTDLFIFTGIVGLSVSLNERREQGGGAGAQNF